MSKYLPGRRETKKLITLGEKRGEAAKKKNVKRTLKERRPPSHEQKFIRRVRQEKKRVTNRAEAGKETKGEGWLVALGNKEPQTKRLEEDTRKAGVEKEREGIGRQDGLNGNNY